MDFLCFISEIEVILFLHSCKYSTEYAKQVIDSFLTCRTHCPEFFKDRSLNEIKSALETT